MQTKKYDMALVLSVEAESYKQAERMAKYIAEGLGQEEVNVSATFDYEHDNDGQRVLYLHPEDEPEPKIV